MMHPGFGKWSRALTSKGKKAAETHVRIKKRSANLHAQLLIDTHQPWRTSRSRWDVMWYSTPRMLTRIRPRISLLPMTAGRSHFSRHQQLRCWWVGWCKNLSVEQIPPSLKKNQKKWNNIRKREYFAFYVFFFGHISNNRDEFPWSCVVSPSSF